MISQVDTILNWNKHAILTKREMISSSNTSDEDSDEIPFIAYSGNMSARRKEQTECASEVQGAGEKTLKRAEKIQESADCETIEGDSCGINLPTAVHLENLNSKSQDQTRPGVKALALPRTSSPKQKRSTNFRAAAFDSLPPHMKMMLQDYREYEVKPKERLQSSLQVAFSDIYARKLMHEGIVPRNKIPDAIFDKGQQLGLWRSYDVGFNVPKINVRRYLASKLRKLLGNR